MIGWRRESCCKCCVLDCTLSFMYTSISRFVETTSFPYKWVFGFRRNLIGLQPEEFVILLGRLEGVVCFCCGKMVEVGS